MNSDKRNEARILAFMIELDLRHAIPIKGGVMKEQVQLDGLLLSSDAQVLLVMDQILNSFAIQTEVCTEVRSALEAVTHRRLDAVIVDWNVANDPARVVRSARKSSPNSNSTIVALVGAGSETHALLVGANFMIYKPVDLDHASRCMRAAYGTMLQERRRAARVSVDIPVVARISEIGILDARVSDLSIGGLALQCERPLQIDREVSLVCSLPGTNGVVRIQGKVVNGNATGRAGIRFSFVPEEDLNLLESWLATELAKLEHAEMPRGEARVSSCHEDAASSYVTQLSNQRKNQAEN
jgi:ActR/RegA family two-component response regulator